MPKSPDAFRTISEVAEWLGIQAHVLRFWESKFTQVKPIKRAGGRRYYRPNDMLLLGGIRQLLHEDGLTIKGVQKILREEGMGHVSSLSQPLDELTQSQIDDGSGIGSDAGSGVTIDMEAPMQIEAEPETGVVLSFEAPSAKEPAQADLLDGLAVEPVDESDPDVEVPSEVTLEPVDDTIVERDAPAKDAPTQDPSDAVYPGDAVSLNEANTAPSDDPAPENEAPEAVETTDVSNEAEAGSPEPAPLVVDPALEESAVEEPTVEETKDEESKSEDSTGEEPATATLPAFLRRPMAEEPAAASDNSPAAETDVPPEPEPELAAPKPRIIDMPQITPLDDITASPALLTATFRTRSLTKAQAKDIAPLLGKLTVLRDSMAARRHNAGSDGPGA